MQRSPKQTEGLQRDADFGKLEKLCRSSAVAPEQAQQLARLEFPCCWRYRQGSAVGCRIRAINGAV